METKDQLTSVLSNVLNTEINVFSVKNLSGGCINNAVKVASDKGDFFVKWNQKSDMFKKEADGLRLIEKSQSVPVPEILGTTTLENTSYLVLSYIASGTASSDYGEVLGRRLAKMHGFSSDSFGLSYSNYIGSLPQQNDQKKEWTEFFISERLEFQLKMAEKSGKVSTTERSKFESLYKKLPDLLIQEEPSLLHGDLWGGNVMVNEAGEAALIDPAVYFGNREVDLAMTKLFGGFNQDFYDAYYEACPVEAGIEDRLDIYTLYPLMVHVNIFGGGYLNSVKMILNRFV